MNGRLGFVSVGAAPLPTRHGTFTCRVVMDARHAEHVVMVRGDVSNKERVLTRIHSECLTGEAFGSMKCDCAGQLDAALDAIGASEEGILIYLRQEGRGIGLGNKIRAYAVQAEQQLDTLDANIALGFPADARTYDLAAAILKQMGVRSIRIMTNNPEKISGISECGIEVVDQVPLVVEGNPHSREYLDTKRVKFGHLLPI